VEDKLGEIIKTVEELFGVKPVLVVDKDRPLVNLQIPDTKANRDKLIEALKKKGIQDFKFRKGERKETIPADLTWKEKVVIADDVLLTYRRITQPNRQMSMLLWNIRQGLKTMLVCEVCGSAMTYLTEAFTPEHAFEIFQCANKHQKLVDISEGVPRCEVCQQPLPITGFSSGGLKFGECRNLRCRAVRANVRRI